MVALFDTAGRVDLELERFESIRAGDHHSLFRVEGRWLLAPGVDAPTPSLIVQVGSRYTPFAPLPGAADYEALDGRLWTAGYTLPLDLVLDARVRYWLKAGDGPRYPLPQPQAAAQPQARLAEVAPRRSRPPFLRAAGLMAVALAPLAGASPAAAQEPAPAQPAPADTTTPPEATLAADATATAAAPDPATAATATPAAPAAPADPAAATPAPALAGLPTAAAQPADPQPGGDATPAAIEVVDTPKHHHKAKHDDKAKAEPKHKKPKKHSKHREHERARHEHAERKHPTPQPAQPRHARPVHHIPAAPAPTATPTGPAPQPAPHLTRVPSPLQQRFAVPPFLLPIYQAASVEYDVPWTVLAAINRVETDYGRNLNISSAGAQGWMQFMPSTWSTYGVDANLDGHRDAADPADAIFAAARYLKAAGAATDLRRAIFAYNHADWYVDDVLAKARALDRVPTGAIAALTGLAIGRFPVPGPHVTYTRAEDGWVTADGASHSRTAARVNGPAGRAVVAPTTVKVLYLGRSHNGVFAVLEDAYGNRFTYGHLAHTVRTFARVRPRRPSAAEIAHELRLDARRHGMRLAAYHAAPAVAKATWPTGKERLYANPGRPGQAPLDATHPSALAAAARRLGVRPSEVVMARLRPGAVVPAGTVIGRLGGALTGHDGHAHVLVRIHPAGKHAHSIDPAPLLESWRAAARGATGPKSPTSSRTGKRRKLGLGRTLLLDDHELGRAVLFDPRVRLTHSGRDDVRSGLVDRRVLVTLETLADAGLHPAVSALRSGPAGDKARALGRGLEIVALNGDRLPATRDTESPASRALRALRALPDPLAPRHARLTATADGATLARAASTSTAEGRLTVSFPRRPQDSRRVGRALNALLSGNAPIVAGAQVAAAPDLHGAPEAVKAIAAGAGAIAGLPYVWGGGHGSWDAGGYDCSGSVSYALHAAGLLDAPLTSGELANWGEAGPGRWVTIYANPTHVIMQIGGQFYGTSGFGHPETGGGPGWFSVTPSPDYLAGFTVRHPEGL